MRDLNDMQYFAEVVDAKGFAAAGRSLGIPKSRLSRRIAGLEARLGVRLLQRSTRKLVLTDVGERYFQQCQAMLQAADAADEAVALVSSEPRGRLRMSCPVALAQADLARWVPEFLARFPQVQLDLLVTNRAVDVLQEGVDLALRIRSVGDEEPELVTRHLFPTRVLLVAAPELLAQRSLNHPSDLLGVPVLGAVGPSRRLHWPLTNAAGQIEILTPEPRLAVDAFAMRRHAALQGLGVTSLPEPYCRDDLAQGRLVEVLAGWRLPDDCFALVYPHRRGLLPSVRALVDFLVAAYAPGV